MIRTIGYLDWVGLKSYQGLFSSSFGLRRQVQLKCKRVSRDKDKGQGVKEERETLQYVSDFRHSLLTIVHETYVTITSLKLI